MIKQTRICRGVTAVGLLCLFGQSCGSKQVQPAHPRTASLKTSSRPPKNPYKKVKPAKMSEYLKMLYRSSQASRIREIGKEPAAEMSFEARKIAARIEQEPENLGLTKQLAGVLIREGHLVEAFETLDRVRSLPATDPEIEAGLALVWQKLGSTSSALYHAQQAVLLDRSAANLALLGKIQLQRADFGKALATLKKAHVSYPDSQSLVLALARAAAGVSDWEAARSYFERTLELNPESVPAREGLVTALVRLDEVNDAFTELRRLFEEGETYARLGQELMAAERWSEAQKALKKALEYSPENRELALKAATVDSYLPFPTVVSLNLGDGVAIDVQSITVQTAYSVVELRGGQVLISTPELESGIGAGRASGGIDSSVVVNLSSMDAIAELGPYSSVEKAFFRRTVSPNVVELVELANGSRDPVVSFSQFSPALPVNLPDSQSIFPGLHEVSEPAPAPSWDGDELAQLPLSRNLQVIQLFNGTVVASDQSGAAVLNDSEPFEEQEIQSWELEAELARVRVAVFGEQVTVSMGPKENSRSAEPALEPEPSAREAIPDPAPAGSYSPGYQVENQPEVVQSLLEAWEGVSPDQWQVVPDTGQSSGNLQVEQPPEEAEKPAQTNEVANYPNLTDIRKLPMRRKTALKLNTRGALTLFQKREPEEIEVAEQLPHPVSSSVAVEIPVEALSGLSEADDFTNADATEPVLDQVSLSALESVLAERRISLSAEAEIVEVEVEAVDEDFAPALEAEVTVADDEDMTLHVTPEETAETPVQTAPEAPPAQVDPEMEEGSPLQPDLLCQLQGSTPASRAIPIIDSLMEEGFRQEGWTLRSDLRDGIAAESHARAMRNQSFTLWLPLTGLTVLALLGFLLRRREPAAVVLEKGSEEK